MQRWQLFRGPTGKRWLYQGLGCALALVVGTFRISAQLAPDSTLEVYAVNVVKTPPFEKQVTGYGVYLGQGLVLTAAHVIGHWPLLTHPHVLIAGEDLPAKIIKKGAFETTDLALLSVDQDRMPISLRLRRNPLCKMPPQIGMSVVNVLPHSTLRDRVISPSLIPPTLQQRFDSLIGSPKDSGSGIFDPEQQCLLGIVSAKVEKFAFRRHFGWVPNGFAGYFVSNAKIVDFLPQGIHY